MKWTEADFFALVGNDTLKEAYRLVSSIRLTMSEPILEEESVPCCVPKDDIDLDVFLKKTIVHESLEQVVLPEG